MNSSDFIKQMNTLFQEQSSAKQSYFDSLDDDEIVTLEAWLLCYTPEEYKATRAAVDHAFAEELNDSKYLGIDRLSSQQIRIMSNLVQSKLSEKLPNILLPYLAYIVKDNAETLESINQYMDELDKNPKFPYGPNGPA
jgi:hypothetical protein